jgi:hypothetical protein
MIGHFGFCVLDPAGMGGTFKNRERFNNAVFVSPKREFLFTKCEKCANVTVRRSLQNLVAEKTLPASMTDIDRWYAPLLQPSDLKLTRIKSINDIPFKFAVVRNPYSRLLSFYLNVKPENYPNVMHGKTKPPTFGGFVDHVTSQSVPEMNPHWRVQSQHLLRPDQVRPLLAVRKPGRGARRDHVALRQEAGRDPQRAQEPVQCRLEARGPLHAGNRKEGAGQIRHRFRLFRLFQGVAGLTGAAC